LTAIKELTEQNSKITDIWNFLVSAAIESNQWRAVLSWAEQPKDLDATVVLPNNEIVNFQKQLSLDSLVKLDTDAQQGFGPETITITNKLKGTERYSYYVNNYSQTPSMTYKGAATVVLYNGDKLVRTFKIPTEGDGLYWWVFDLTANGEVDINKIVDGIQLNK